MVVRMTVGVIPDNRDVAPSKRTVVASADWLVPWVVNGREIQFIGLDVVFQPFAERRVGFGVEIVDQRRTALVAVPPNHVIIQVGFYAVDFGERLHKILRTQQPLLLSVPKSKDDGALRLHAGGQKSLCYLQHGRNTGSVVVCPVVDLVSVQCRVEAQMVIMRPDDDIFVRAFSLYFS